MHFVSDLSIFCVAFPFERSGPGVPPPGPSILNGDFAGEPRPEIFMTNLDAWHNPSEDYPPSRPGRLVFLGAAVVCAIGAIVLNWASVSSFVHVPEIKSALGF